MTERTEAPPGAARLSSGRKPTVSIFLATACGLGYLPKAPGTWGSLAGLLAAVVPWLILRPIGVVAAFGGGEVDPYLSSQILLTILIALAGVWCATNTARFWAEDDPQKVVIDEVSGQHVALLVGCAIPVWWKAAPPSAGTQFGFVTLQSPLNWKYLLAGFILFRAFDIWKPFPARQAEALPRGWGIMADDWIAGVYAGLLLWLARGLGL
jgi:phosphatidylglycerophosphatase A